MPAPKAPAPTSTKKPDDAIVVVKQVQTALVHVERALMALEPGQKRYLADYDRLRQVRDELEGSLLKLQSARLRAGALNFGTDVDRLRDTVLKIEAATLRTVKTREILGYLAMVIDLGSQIAARVLSFL